MCVQNSSIEVDVNGSLELPANQPSQNSELSGSKKYYREQYRKAHNMHVWLRPVPKITHVNVWHTQFQVLNVSCYFTKMNNYLPFIS